MGNTGEPGSQPIERTMLKSAMAKLRLDPKNPDDIVSFAEFCARLARRYGGAANISNFGPKLSIAFSRGRRQITVPPHIAAGITEVHAFKWPGSLSPQPATA